ncbi:hypothetical protein AgCh_017118 [Apium graveolens]
MGVCWSSQIKIDTHFHTGDDSKYVSRDTQNISNSYSKGSSTSIPATPRSEGEILQSPNLKSFTFSELRNSTRNFRPDSVLGEGGFGSVFKGWIDEQSFAASNPGTGTVIAVKRLNQEGLHKEWLAKINYLGQLSHPNLVKLMGYCLEDNHRLLVYEYMPKGSMENHLFKRGSHFQPLSWGVRMKVALGAARGLAFLHGVDNQVIYREFKTSNILLDPKFNAKLSDFGLARDGPTGDRRHVPIRVMGPHGYAAPEYLSTGIFKFLVKNKLVSYIKYEKNGPEADLRLVSEVTTFLRIELHGWTCKYTYCTETSDLAFRFYTLECTNLRLLA